MIDVYKDLKDFCQENKTTLVAVSKTKPNSAILDLYQKGQRTFGENRVQELVEKQNTLPTDIQWHMIGHLQTNKVKFIAPFVSMIHSGDRMSLLKAINKEAEKSDRIIDVLLQIKIATEDSKHGWKKEELIEVIEKKSISKLSNINIRGLMGMATFTEDLTQIEAEFKSLKSLFTLIETKYKLSPQFDTLSMGMSGDYKLAVSSGSNMIRVGSLLFGTR